MFSRSPLNAEQIPAHGDSEESFIVFIVLPSSRAGFGKLVIYEEFPMAMTYAKSARWV